MRSVVSSLDGVPVSDDTGIAHVSGTYYVYGPELIWAADADLGASRSHSRTISAQANGSTTTVAGGQITGTSQDGSTLRLGTVADPDNGAKNCWRFRAHSGDSDTSGTGNKRSEILPATDSEAYSMVMDRRYVIGFWQRVPSWSGTTDEQLIWQIHDGAASAVSPWVAQYVVGGTRRVDVRYSLNADHSGVAVSTIYTAAVIPDTWERFVLEVVESQTAGIARVWINGAKVADYSGPLGYQEPNGRGSYWKQGVYHWTTGNAWDATIPLRECWMKGAYISNSCTVDGMDAFLESVG